MAEPVRDVLGPTACLERVVYDYPGWSAPEQTAPVLDRANVELWPGVTLLTGDSGSGKSTLLRVLNGLIPHFHGGRFGGRATVCGLDVLATPTRSLARQVGFVFQEPEVGFVRGTVEREVAFGPENLGLPGATIRRQVGEAMERAGITGLAGRRLRTLSGGERQRVALAAALAASPTAVVMDEPMSQLDEEGAAALHATLGTLGELGHTVVVAEHRFARFGGADRILAMASGRLVETSAVPPEGRLLSRRGDLRYPFADAPTAWSLDGVTLGVAGRVLVEDVHAAGAMGEVVVVTGANGAGKTTLLRTVAGLLAPLRGTVDRRPGRIAYLPQEPGVLLHRPSVRAEVEQTLNWTGARGGADNILGLLGLAAVADRDPRDLSVGQRQRAALAAVLAGAPSLALLDEPTRGMDDAARRSLAEVLRTMTEAGASVVMATHDEQLAEELGDRVLRIDEGAVRPRTAEATR